MLRLTTVAAAFGLITLGIQGLAPCARGQAIAFEPVIGFVPTGSTLTVTPVVSADRRYVRLSVNPFFNALNGFSTFGIPGAVSGGPSVNAGMNGVIGPDGFGDGGGINPYGFVGNVGEMRAGPIPMNVGLGAANSLAQNNVVMDGPAALMNGGPEGAFDGSQAWPLGMTNRSVASGGQRGRSSAKAVSKQRRTARKAATKSKSTTAEPSIRPAR